MVYISLILNIPWTLVGLIAGLISVPKKIRFSSNPKVVTLYVRSFWWFTWRKEMKKARAMAIGNVVLLGPLTMDKDFEHELVHVRQIEREPLIYPFLYAYQNMRYGYRNNKYEREAYDTTDSVYLGKEEV